MRYDQMLGRPDCPYEFSLGLKKGAKYRGKPPYPELLVLSADDTHVREIRWQRIVVRAESPETGKKESVQVMRLVAVLEGDVEMEMSRIALPAKVVEEQEKADPTTCAGCGTKILGPDCPYEFSLGLKKGAKYRGKPPYPELLVLSADDTHVREIRWQRIVVRAESPETGKKESVQVMRLVAVLEGDVEMEMSRIALPAKVVEEQEKADPTTCAGCGTKIPMGAGVQGDDGLYYHAGRCYQE